MAFPAIIEIYIADNRAKISENSHDFLHSSVKSLKYGFYILGEGP